MFEFDRDWLPDLTGAGFVHGGLTVSPRGVIVMAAPNASRLVKTSAEGEIIGSIDVEAIEAHGLTAGRIGNRSVVWIADPGFKVIVEGTMAKADREVHGRVFAVDIDTGATVVELDPPPHRLYDSTLYRPTAVCAVEDGGSSVIWVADGYGASLVHQYDAGGTYLRSFDGTSGAGRFDCPHALILDAREQEPMVCVADRGNHRVQVFDPEGRFHHSFGEGELTSPSAFAFVGGYLVVAELEARLVVLDDANRPVEVVGWDPVAVSRPGWPNELDNGHLRRPSRLLPGVLNSPHSLAAPDQTTLLVSEYVLGGRVSRFRFAAANPS